MKEVDEKLGGAHYTPPQSQECDGTSQCEKYPCEEPQVSSWEEDYDREYQEPIAIECGLSTANSLRDFIKQEIDKSYKRGFADGNHRY